MSEISSWNIIIIRVSMSIYESRKSFKYWLYFTDEIFLIANFIFNFIVLLPRVNYRKWESSIKRKVQCFSQQVVINRCFHLSLEKNWCIFVLSFSRKTYNKHFLTMTSPCALFRRILCIKYNQGKYL